MKRFVLILLSLVVVVFLAVLMIHKHLDRRDTTGNKFAMMSASLTNAEPAPIPIAPVAISEPTATTPALPGSALEYEDSLSFAENLQRLKQFCNAHAQNQRLPVLLDVFVKAMLSRAKTEFHSIKTELMQPDGTASYRNLLLACLMSADAPAREKADVVWKVALDKAETIEVRRTAAYLTGRVEDTEKRSDALFALLNDTDGQVAVAALANSTAHLDQRSYDVIKGTLVNSPDIHVRIAAVSAIGRAGYSDTQQTLKDIVAATQTSKEDKFSESTLPKRAAIPHMNMRDPGTYQFVKQIALNENEDPGVRAKAINRFAPAEYPEATPMLMQLLQKLDAENTVPLRAVVDTLLTSPTPENLQAVRERADALTDPQVRSLILKRIEIATQKGIK